MASPISQAMKAIAEEKGIAYDSVLETVEAALAAAYRKDFGNKNQNIRVQFDPEHYDGQTAGIRVFDVKTVVEDMELPEAMPEEEEKQKSKSKNQKAGSDDHRAPSTDQAASSEPEEPVFNPKLMIMISDARDIKPDAVIGEEIRVELNVPAAFGRMAAQTAKQVVLQKLREAERTVIYNDFKGREGELMNVTIQRREGRVVLIDLGRATGIMLPEDQIETERYYPGTRIKAWLREVVLTGKGPEIRLSRSSPQLVAALFAQEIPEISNGVVEIKGIAREAGSRTKIAVSTNDDAIDPIGSCIGQRGTRIQTMIRELNGEKIDIIEWSDKVEKYVEAALSPAKVLGVERRDDERLAVVSVNADQLSLAIGKGGQNVRLAAKLTGWKITIVEQGGKVMADSEMGPVEEAPVVAEAAIVSPDEVREEATEEVKPEEVKPEKSETQET